MFFVPHSRRSRSAASRAVVSAALWLGAVFAVSAQQNVFTPVITVSDATFRSRWAGPQVDESGAIALAPTSEGIRPVEDFATKLREGLHIGSLRFRPGLGFGWDYSDRNYEGQDTTSLQNNQSFYLAPTLGLEYARDIGPWSLAASYGGSYTYFLNRDYSASGSGNARNPFNNTASLGFRHTGMRHSAQLNGGASYGNGENIQANGYTTTFVGGATLSYDYLINEFLTTGAYGNYNAQITRYEENDQDGSDLATIRAGAYIDWLATGKTTAGIRLEAGRLSSELIENTTDEEVLNEADSQTESADSADSASATASGESTADTKATVASSTAVSEEESEVQARQYVQVLAAVAHNLTAKVLIVGGLGASYTVDENIVDVDSKYTGVRPVYLLGLQFDPSEKTSLRAYTSFQGADVVPSYGLSLTWRPRMNTSLTLSAYQTQNFSITSIDQFQINRGVVLSLQQILFSKLTVGLSGGWQQTEAVSLSTAIEPTDPIEYAFVSGSLSWKFNSWASWVATVRASSGNGSSSTGTESDSFSFNALSFPETTASVGFNLLF